MIGRTLARRSRTALKPALFRERAHEAERFVASRRRPLRTQRMRRVQLLASGLAFAAVFGLSLLIAGGVLAGTSAALEGVATQLQRLIPNPVIDREAAPSAQTAPNGAPILDALDRATKDARLVVSGRVPSFALVGGAPRVEILVNGTLVAIPAVDDTGRFTATVALADGTNTVVVATVRGTERVQAAPRTVTLDTKPPALAVAKPAEGDSVDGPSFLVQGKTEANATVTVNGRATGVTTDGAFSASIQASPGALTIDVVARDQAGNETKKTVHVTVKAVNNLGVLVGLATSSVRPGAPFVVDVLVTDQGVPLVNASVSVTEGFVTLASGRTDAGGHYRAIVVAPTSEGIVQIVALANGPSGSGRGAATLDVSRN